ncbi:MAG: VanZ family protein [Cyanobacteria bacterium REEB67]|nr:VanZ family protein [Cyanobacteria bacterium REEB67]
MIVTLLWMAVIFAFSNQANSGHITEACFHAANVPVRKLGHISEFAILALLYFQTITAFRRGAGQGDFEPKPLRTALQALLLAFAWACLDEVHQSFVPGRSAAFSDVLIDTSGMVLALSARHWLCGRRESRS